MRFSLFTPVLALASLAMAQMPASVVVDNINIVTNLSAETNKIAVDIKPFTIFTKGPKVIDNFRQIVQIVGKDIKAMSDSPEPPKYSESEQQAICDAFRKFVVVHQNLLKTVIGKAGIFSRTPLTAPMAAVLRALEAGVDNLAFGIINSVPTCADGAKQNKQDLDMTLADAIDAYSS